MLYLGVDSQTLKRVLIPVPLYRWCRAAVSGIIGFVGLLSLI